jgi:hypothetical protein
VIFGLEATADRGALCRQRVVMSRTRTETTVCAEPSAAARTCALRRGLRSGLPRARRRADRTPWPSRGGHNSDSLRWSGLPFLPVRGWSVVTTTM